MDGGSISYSRNCQPMFCLGCKDNNIISKMASQMCTSEKVYSFVHTYSLKLIMFISNSNYYSESGNFELT